MFNTPSFSTFVASLLFCLGIGVLTGAGSQARAAENGENTPVVRQPIVGGTPFPNLYHYEDPSTRTEVWSISPPRTADSDMDAPDVYKRQVPHRGIIHGQGQALRTYFGKRDA